MNYTDNVRKILSWAEEDRPREKLILKGKAALSDAELLAILIGSGTVSESAVDVAKKILSRAENNLNQLAQLGLKELQTIKGIGEAKAITIVAAMELGRRRREATPIARAQITTSRQVYEEMKPYLLDKHHEEFWLLLLNRANLVIKPMHISTGGVAGTIVDPKLVFKCALEHLASAIILVHNHPSGSLVPSKADKELTKQLLGAGQILDIPVLDHLIFTNGGYLSFADEGILH